MWSCRPFDRFSSNQETLLNQRLMYLKTDQFHFCDNCQKSKLSSSSKTASNNFSNYRLGLHRLKPSFPLLVKHSLHFFSIFFQFIPFFEQKTVNHIQKDHFSLFIRAQLNKIDHKVCQEVATRISFLPHCAYRVIKIKL